MMGAEATETLWEVNNTYESIFYQDAFVDLLHERKYFFNATV